MLAACTAPEEVLGGVQQPEECTAADMRQLAADMGCMRVEEAAAEVE